MADRRRGGSLCALKVQLLRAQARRMRETAVLVPHELTSKLLAGAAECEDQAEQAEEQQH